MKHIQDKNDWFYELRPHGCIVLGIVGFFSRGLIGGYTGLALLAYASSLTLIAMGFYIFSMRRNYRKSMTWMK